MNVLPCTVDDVISLAQMNRLLIEDEQAENSMTQEQLEQRMDGFLRGDYKAFFFQAEDAVVGYSLMNMAAAPLYLRQFFICRDARKKGYGRAAFYALLDALRADTIDIDVYAWNAAGIAFWKSLGFQERFYNMRLKKQARTEDVSMDCL